MFSRRILLYLRDPVEYVPPRGWPNRSHLLIAYYSVTFLHPSSLPPASHSVSSLDRDPYDTLLMYLNALWFWDTVMANVRGRFIEA